MKERDVFLPRQWCAVRCWRLAGIVNTRGELSEGCLCVWFLRPDSDALHWPGADRSSPVFKKVYASKLSQRQTLECFLTYYHLSNHSGGGEYPKNHTFVIGKGVLSKASNKWTLFVQLWSTEPKQEGMVTEKTEFRMSQTPNSITLLILTGYSVHKN